MSADLKELQRSTQTGFLRAMAKNYKNGHRWDHLDSKVCIQAAEEIDALRAALARLEQAIADAARLEMPIDERPIFEFWAKNTAGLCVEKNSDGEYLNCDSTGDAWDAWQARAALQSQEVTK